MQNITVKFGKLEKTVDINSNLFDNVYIEACTRVVEILYKENSLRIPAVMICFITNKPKKQIICNSYKILINAGMHIYAERLRQILLLQTLKNWADEPITSK